MLIQGICIFLLIPIHLIRAFTFPSFPHIGKPTSDRIVSVNPETGMILDSKGRSRVFRGVNIVYKEFPWYPKLDSFDVRYSFSKEDVDILADLGMNVIRLDVSWAGAEPRKGVYNETYFQQIHRIVDMCAERGLYVLLEWHQDLFSERYCGNGAPLWASRSFSPKGRFGYPFPAWSPFKLDNQTRIPLKEDCSKFNNFALGYFNWHLSQAFDDLYTNYNGVRDSFINFWKKIATEFKDKPNILGYELMNEPWVGQFYTHVPLTVGTNADLRRLQPLYDLVYDAIRTIDQDTLIFYESVNVNFGKIGFSHGPGGLGNATKTVLAWHWYFNPIGKQRYIRSREKEARRLGTVSFATEFDISWDGTLRPNLTLEEGGIQVKDSLDTMQLLDELKISWTGWEYKTYIRKTGWGDGLFDEKTGLVRPKMATLYSRPYAKSVTGPIHGMVYNDETGIFSLLWTVPSNSSSEIPTEVYLNTKWHYPKGYDVLITPLRSSFHRVAGDTLFINTKKSIYPQLIELTIRPKKMNK